MKTIRNIKAFTLLELVVVIMVIAVFAALAIPRLFSRVEFARSVEAMTSIKIIRSALNRCKLYNQTYENCNFDALDIDNPSDNVGTHFTYTITDLGVDDYKIIATRNNVDDGDGTSTITFTQTADSISKTGTGFFESIK